MNRSLPALFVLLVSLLLPHFLHAQELNRDALQADARIRTLEWNDKTRTPSAIVFRSDAALKTTSAATLIKSLFQLPANGSEVRPQQTTKLASGLQVDKFKHYYKGIPVEHSAYSVLSRNGNIVSLSAESYVLGEQFTDRPALSSEAALAKALAFVNAKKYAWEALEDDKTRSSGNPALFQRLEALRQQHVPKGELVIAKDVYGDGQAKLAWKFDIYAHEPLGRYLIYINAADGKLMLRDMLIKHADEIKNKAHSNATVQQNIGPATLPLPTLPLHNLSPAGLTSEAGTAHTRYAGIRTIQTTRVTVPLGGTPDPNNTSALLSYSGVDPRLPILLPEQVFILKDDTRGGGVETYDMNAVGGAPVSLPGLHAQAQAFTDRNVLAGSQNIWKNEAAGTNEDHIRGATSDGTIGTDEAFNDDYALDAHWGAEMVYDYWKNVHNRLSFDNKNTAIKSYVHYGPAYDNAFWNGSVMTYGDGSGTSLPIGFKPLTSLDVCGHEIGHGVCSFTSDLVYESESGAMNEGLSDIWAASIERYVIVNVDPSLAATYRPFSIGEQIAASPSAPLRRMDAPKEQSNPDTYGGEHWVNPVCTPTLANDQCGVHTNSGVINKWYYLLTVGSAAGSGPDQSYAVPGADDGLRDDGAAYNTIPYAVTGIGFNKAEAITYLMELSLTPTATYAQARTASINAARVLYGECSAEEISVTNAWNAVGVGAVYAGCSLPTISSSSSATDVLETAGGTDCIRYNEYNLNVNLTVAQGAAVTINYTVGSTTMSADEYELSSSSVTYAPGETGQRTVKLRIYDDAMIEADETITINISSSFPALSDSYTFTVRNDDNAPVFSGSTILLNENFEAMTEGAFGAPSPSTWGKIDKIAGNVQWAVRTDGPTPAPIIFNTKKAIIEMTGVAPIPGEALYDLNAEARTILRAPMINASGLNSINVKFNYQAVGEPACDPACDYGLLMYSFDGNNFFPFQLQAPLYLTLTETAFDFTLPASFNGKQFYLGLQWYNDANAGGLASVVIDDFVVTARGRTLESELADSVSEKFNAETGKPSYFYSSADGELITRLVNNTAHNYGCVTASVEKAGNTGFTLYTEGTNAHRVADKIIRITPATNNPAGAYNITLYYTETEIQALESFTSLPRTAFFIYKTSAANYTGATALNTERTAAAYTAIPGLGGAFSASFSTGFSGFALGAAVSIPLPVNCISFNAVKQGSSVRLQWKVNDPANSNAGFVLERSADGITYTAVADIPAGAGNGGTYTIDDVNVNGMAIAYYRLKERDNSGASRYICSVLKVPLLNGEAFVLGNIHPNPAVQDAFINLYSSKAMRVHIEYIGNAGQLIKRQTVSLLPGTTRQPLATGTIAAGSYFIRFVGENGETLGTKILMKQ